MGPSLSVLLSKSRIKTRNRSITKVSLEKKKKSAQFGWLKEVHSYNYFSLEPNHNLDPFNDKSKRKKEDGLSSGK